MKGVDSPIVRSALDKDLPAIHEIYAHHVLLGTASFEETPPTLDEMCARRASVLELGLPYLTAELDGCIVGYSYATYYRARSAYRYTLEDTVYVAPGWHRKGVGAALLARLIECCETGPWRQMVAVIGDTANEGSIGLHSRLGFRVVGTLQAVGFKFGRWVDSVLMQRALGCGDRATARQSTA